MRYSDYQRIEAAMVNRSFNDMRHNEVLAGIGFTQAILRQIAVEIVNAPTEIQRAERAWIVIAFAPCLFAAVVALLFGAGMVATALSALFTGLALWIVPALLYLQARIVDGLGEGVNAMGGDDE